jgi:uncharacterized protein YjbI with pentapeptide repeats
VPSTSWRRQGSGVLSVRRMAKIGVPVFLVVSVLTMMTASPAFGTKLKKPGAPTAVVATPVYEGADISWTAPTNDGGSPITGYSVKIFDHGTCTTDGATVCDVQHLADGHRYEVNVRARNAVGLGPASAKVKVKPDINCSLLDPNTNLQGCDFAGANLSGVNLSGSNLTDANLTGATVTDADFAGTSFTGAVLADVTSGGIIGTPASLPHGWVLSNGYLVGDSANLTDADLSGANLSDLDLDYVILTDANLTDADMTGVTLFQVTSGGIVGTPSSLPSSFVLYNGYLVGTGAILTGANLAGISLVSFNLSDTDLTDANLTGADLAGDNVSAVLRGANFTDANLTGAAADNSDFSGANLTGTNLSGAYLTHIDCGGGIVGTPAALPANWVVINGYLMGPTAALFVNGTSLSGADLSGLDLSGANISDADLNGVNLSDTNLTDAYLLQDTLADVIVTGADMSSTGLAGVSSGGITGTPSALPSGWSLLDGYLMGESDNLTDADLSSADLTGLDLSGSTVIDADLTDANLTDVNFSYANLTGSDLTGANITGVVWTLATCPDGNPSREEGNTCENDL